MQTLRDDKSSAIGKYTVSLQAHSKTMICNGEIIKLTSTEYQLIYHLLDGHVVQDQALAITALGHNHTSQLNQTEMDNLERHIQNIRSKIRPYQLNLYRVHRYGYILAEIKKGRQQRV